MGSSVLVEKQPDSNGASQMTRGAERYGVPLSSEETSARETARGTALPKRDAERNKSQTSKTRATASQFRGALMQVAAEGRARGRQRVGKKWTTRPLPSRTVGTSASALTRQRACSGV